MNKYFLIYTKSAVGGKGSKTHIFILALHKTPTSSKGLVKKYRGVGGGWAGAFGNGVDKKHVTHPLPSAQK